MSGDTLKKLKTAAIVYDEAALEGDAASRDVIEQMAAIEPVLLNNGVSCTRIGVGLDLSALKRRLAEVQPGMVFNLAESLDGSDRLQSMVPMVLEDWGVPFTGCGAAAMLVSNHKIESKALLANRGVPVPECAWIGPRGRLRHLPASGWDTARSDVIVKAIESHASLFIDDSSVLRNPARATLTERLKLMKERHGMAFFAEKFIAGREFNLSLLGGSDTVEVLPPAEITFDDLPSSKPHIVGYAAKWDEESTEYKGTPRRLDFPAGDAPLLQKLRELAAAAWTALGLSGYARVDFRVDEAGQPFVLEVNTNPCLSPDAGFAAAVEKSGRDYAWMVSRIVEAALEA